MYICSHRDNKKISPIFLCVSKVDVNLGMGEHNFRNNPVYVSFVNFRFQSCLSFCFYLGLAIFLQFLKTFFANQNGRFKFAFEKHVHMVLLDIILALTNFTSIRYSVKNFT